MPLELVHPVMSASLATAYSADTVLSPYIYVFYAAFGLSFIFTPIMRRVATFYGVVDRPDKLRKMHEIPVAYLGGIAIFLGWIAGLAMSQFTNVHVLIPGAASHVQVSIGVVAAGCMIVALGLMDDVKGIQPRLKIAGQVAAALVLLASDIGLQSTEPLFRPIIGRLETHGLWISDSPSYEWFLKLSGSALTIALVVFCCNATNLLDGLDGLCGGVTSFIAAGLLFLATWMAMNSGEDQMNDAGMRVVLALALLGAVLGFLPYNFNPASIFMGDTGSLFLGFSIASLIVMMAEREARWLLAGLVMFALPVLDTSLAFARRILAGRPVFSADKAHFHHQLVTRGLSVKKAVLFSYGMTIFFVVCGAAIVFLRTRFAIAFYLVIFGSIIVAAYKIGMVHERVVATPRKIGEGDVIAEPAVESTDAAVLEVIRPASPSQSGAMAGITVEPVGQGKSVS